MPAYGFAFKRLLAMTDRVDLHTQTQYKRVSIFLGRIMIANAPVVREVADRPRPHPMTWTEEFKQFDKDEVITLVTMLQDHEWEMVSKHMRELARKSSGSDAWVRQRMGWVTDLDTLRAFR